MSLAPTWQARVWIVERPCRVNDAEVATIVVRQDPLTPHTVSLHCQDCGEKWTSTAPGWGRRRLG